MEVKDFIKIYDKTIPLTLISAMIRWGNKNNFTKAKVVNKSSEDNVELNEHIRKTEDLPLSYNSDSLTNVHYGSVLTNLFVSYLNKYRNDLKIFDLHFENVNLNFLRYKEGGFYTWHTDHSGTSFPRTMSCILLLNNDYEGGELMFSDPTNTHQIKIETQPGRLIIWPSNFMYPHKVNKVKKGTRYSIVGWAT